MGCCWDGSIDGELLFWYRWTKIKSNNPYDTEFVSDKLFVLLETIQKALLFFKSKMNFTDLKKEGCLVL